MVSNRVSGEELEELKDLAAVHFWPHDNPAVDMSEETGTRILGSGKGVWVDDVQGRRWFDFRSGAWLLNIGHGRKEIGQAVYEQMTEGVYLHAPRYREPDDHQAGVQGSEPCPRQELADLPGQRRLGLRRNQPAGAQSCRA